MRWDVVVVINRLVGTALALGLCGGKTALEKVCICLLSSFLCGSHSLLWQYMDTSQPRRNAATRIVSSATRTMVLAYLEDRSVSLPDSKINISVLFLVIVPDFLQVEPCHSFGATQQPSRCR